jgi:hypothetical protein
MQQQPIRLISVLCPIRLLPLISAISRIEVAMTRKTLITALVLLVLAQMAHATLLIYERASGQIVHISTTAENARMKLERLVLPQRFGEHGDTVWVTRADSGSLPPNDLVVRYFDYSEFAPLYGLIDVRDQGAAVRVVTDSLARVFYGEVRAHDIMLSDSTRIGIDGVGVDTLAVP